MMIVVATFTTNKDQDERFKFKYFSLNYEARRKLKNLNFKLLFFYKQGSGGRSSTEQIQAHKSFSCCIISNFNLKLDKQHSCTKISNLNLFFRIFGLKIDSLYTRLKILVKFQNLANV